MPSLGGAGVATLLPSEEQPAGDSARPLRDRRASSSSLEADLAVAAITDGDRRSSLASNSDSAFAFVTKSSSSSSCSSGLPRSGDAIEPDFDSSKE